LKTISVCGKGGSGKSTIVALLAGELQHRGKRLLVVDSDESNAGLYQMLGFEYPPRPLMELAGGKKRVRRLMRSTFSSGESEADTSVLQQEHINLNEIPSDYIARREGLAMVAVGKIHQALEGCACPMGVLSREFLKRLQLAEDEIAVVDMEAGVEHFGRGVETSIDAVIVVVDPSLESVALAARIRELAEATGARFMGVVVNKVPDDSIKKGLIAKLTKRRLTIVATISYQWQIMEAGLEGQDLTAHGGISDIAGLADALLSAAHSSDPISAK